jgi:hypothetical protein
LGREAPTPANARESEATTAHESEATTARAQIDELFDATPILKSDEAREKSEISEIRKSEIR